MKREQIDPREVQHCLYSHRYSGVALGNLTMAECYAAVASSPPTHPPGDLHIRDWAAISYVHTESAVASGGMPEWVCADIDTVLDGLLRTRRLGKRAVWFDLLAMHSLPQKWPAVATLNSLSCPLIAVPPTRTLEYSRYQIPDRWDPDTSDFYTRLELLLRHCPHCSSKSPLEYDSRLLNIAATLRAWPLNDVMIACASRGAFISFATLDRFSYTFRWYVLLLQVAMRIARYDLPCILRVSEVYGPPLFEICYTCLSLAAEIAIGDSLPRHITTLDETLSTLLAHANRLCLPFTFSQSEGSDIWSLSGCAKSPGDLEQVPPDNASRLDAVTGQILLQSRYEQIAASILRGPSAQAPCFRHGDKWMCAIILSNISDFLCAFQRSPGTFETEMRTLSLRLLLSANSLGDVCYEDNGLDTSILGDGNGNACVQSPVCDGRAGSVCFLNQLSGILPPEAVGQFLSSCGLTEIHFPKVLGICHETLYEKLVKEGNAFYGYEYPDPGRSANELCIRCRYHSVHGIHMFTTMMVITWQAKMPASNAIDEFELVPHSSICSYVAIDMEESGHVVLRGVFNTGLISTCPQCLKAFVRANVANAGLLKTDAVFEIHVSQNISIISAMSSVYDVFSDSHDR